MIKVENGNDYCQGVYDGLRNNNKTRGSQSYNTGYKKGLERRVRKEMMAVKK